MSDLIHIRVTGILIKDDQLLVVEQKVNPLRDWSLPGGRVEQGEALDQSIRRELLEETGLEVEVKGLLYVCDVPDASPAVLHVTFQLEKK